ncbi:DUF2254 domain-containing protein [Porphyrobacter algicida]|uniref:DUF2254 domain-containing protein n=1 Tax=Qipengyuania algicida TaxID=1836209 RepID=A0A845AGN3_9SPHN|nr:DUF2254 domain-containing protein [Qipengyuania algicida]MXP27716.1 DUF2254 domain-containing protein [Qipengyuania algicida]
MIAKLSRIWQTVNASYWFYPALFSVGALLLALFTITLDRGGYTAWMNDIDWLQSARPSGASNMLSVIAGSTIGVAATVFSITIAAVAYASGNYGPRLLTNFMENRGNQLSLATFIATFVYAITVLRVVRKPDEAPVFFQHSTTPGFVPQLSLLLAFAFMGLSVMVLVYFLNHIPSSIRINTVLEQIGQRLLRDIGTTFPDPDRGAVVLDEPGGRAVRADGVGYVQHIDFDRLRRIANTVGGRLQLGVRTGDFLHDGLPLAYWQDDDSIDDLRDKEIRECFVLAGLRTPAQDLHFLIDELVEIGLRALSPGINDPFTAISALHWLGAATAELGRRDLSRKVDNLVDKDIEEDRLQLLDDDFRHFVQRGLGSMRSAVATSPNAALVAFSVIHGAAEVIDDASRHHTLMQEGEQLIEQARIALDGPDLAMVEARYQSFHDKMVQIA